MTSPFGERKSAAVWVTLPLAITINLQHTGSKTFRLILMRSENPTTSNLFTIMNPVKLRMFHSGGQIVPRTTSLSDTSLTVVITNHRLTQPIFVVCIKV